MSFILISTCLRFLCKDRYFLSEFLGFCRHPLYRHLSLACMAYFFNGYIAISCIAGIIINIYCYLRILCQARKASLQIQNESARFGEVNITAMDKRYLTVNGVIIVSMIVCFIPVTLSNFLWVAGYRNEPMRETRCLEWILVMANSTITPIITCRFCPSARKKVLKILT